MSQRVFPLSPKSTKALEVGDLIAVPCESSGWACIQVRDLRAAGVGSRSCFIAGVLSWRGDDRPTPQDVAGLVAVEQGLARVELFTEGGLEVVANAPVTALSPSASGNTFSGSHPGLKYRVWGWMALVRIAQETSAKAP
jgi:hypothetical protein